MATSPNTSTLTSPNKKKDESLLDKIGTLGRKKKVKEGRILFAPTKLSNDFDIKIANFGNLLID